MKTDLLRWVGITVAAAGAAMFAPLARAQQADTPVRFSLPFHVIFSTGSSSGAFNVQLIDETGSNVSVAYGMGPSPTPWVSPEVTAKIIPGKNYTMTMHVDPGCTAQVVLSPVPGAEAPVFALYVNNTPTTGYAHSGGVPGNFSDTVGLFPAATEMHAHDPSAMVGDLRGRRRRCCFLWRRGS